MLSVIIHVTQTQVESQMYHNGADIAGAYDCRWLK